MNKFLKLLSGAAAGLLAAAALTITAFAEDYTFEIAEPVQSNGSWGQSFSYYTANDQGHPDNFDTTWMTYDSEVIVDYTYEGTPAAAPLELIWQTWDGPVERDPDIKADWNKVAPAEYDETSAVFTFDDIAAAYGSEDFSAVYAINVGDTGVKLTVTGVTITNCNIPAETTAAPSAGETGEAGVETTEETVTEATTNIVENAPDEEGNGTLIITIVIAVVAVAAIITVAVLIVKTKKRRYY